MADLGAIESAQLLKREFIEIEGVEEWIDKIYRNLVLKSEQGEWVEDLYMTGKISKSQANMMLGKEVRHQVRRVLSQVRKEMQKRAKASMHSDPRKASQSVKMARWKKELGGSVSLYNTSKADKRYAVVSARNNRKGMRGGNRLPRSSRTEQVDGYYGKDRAFILRFINQGTTARETRFGNRGSIGARGFFRDANGVMQAEVGKMTARLEALINEVGEL